HMRHSVVSFPFFFFQAEDGIRYFHVTGVQTCALPIFALCGCIMKTQQAPPSEEENLIVVGFSQVGAESEWRVANTESIKSALSRSEERRVGKEGSTGRWAAHQTEESGLPAWRGRLAVR